MALHKSDCGPKSGAKKCKKKSSHKADRVPKISAKECQKNGTSRKLPAAKKSERV